MPKIELPDAPATAATMEKRPPGMNPPKVTPLLQDALMRHSQPVPTGGSGTDAREREGIHLPPITFEIDGGLVMAVIRDGTPDEIKIANDEFAPRVRRVEGLQPTLPLSTLIYDALAKAAQVELSAFVDRIADIQEQRQGEIYLGRVKFAIAFEAYQE